MSAPDQLRAVEFFSGIGGLHYGLEMATPPSSSSVVAAFDINQISNSIYEHNFGLKPSSRTITALTTQELDALAATIWLLSPPCQPFTQGGKGLDDTDERSRPLLHLIDILPQLAHPPRYLFVENVPNFETSRCRERLTSALMGMRYEVREYMMSPMQFGVPNDRRRYYMTARLCSDVDETLNVTNANLITSLSAPVDPAPLSTYLETLNDATPYLIPPEYISKRTGFRFDIVTPDSTRTSTITKAYGTRMVTRSGSFLQTLRLGEQPDFETTSSLEYGIRWLTPREVARLHCFPIDGATEEGRHGFEFPEGVNLKQRWAVLGNSLNCRVIAEIMKRLFAE
ncbi:C-5 cytosine-specific DNA methylase [Irineochytrium annulatum]|nr:C-5 cytosine-specific DNA methylase [Irineochytrium annulatum]